ncbi:MAG: polysaccharide deacetylase family protein [Polyangiaceae bacterium]
MVALFAACSAESTAPTAGSSSAAAATAADEANPPIAPTAADSCTTNESGCGALGGRIEPPCESASPVSAECDDANACTLDRWDPTGGCVHDGSGVAGPCDDADACTVGDACLGDHEGTCVPGRVVDCDDGNPCTLDRCDPLQGCQSDGTGQTVACSDGNACTVGDRCQGDASGTCVAGEPLVCGAGTACAAEACDPKTGCASDVARSFERTAPVARKTAALTFDDGPRVGATPKILDLLAEHHHKAVFFVVGKAINHRTYAILQRVIAEGHELGLHSYNHDMKMATYGDAATTEAYILGEHEVTRALVDIALLATSEDDFDALFSRVMGVQPFAFISDRALVDEREAIVRRLGEVLTERGFTDGKRPSVIRYSRPPGGGPFLAGPDEPGRAIYLRALAKLGYINVMWHGASGDTVEGRLHDVGYLVDQTVSAGKRGGVVLLHDIIDKEALGMVLKLFEHESIKVVKLEELIVDAPTCVKDPAHPAAD